MREHRALHLVGRDDPAQDEVAIGNLALLAQANPHAIGRRPLDVDRMQRRGHVPDRHAGGDVRRDGQVVPGTRSLGRDRRADAIGVGDTRRRHEARADDGRHDQLERALAKRQRLDVLDPDLHRRPRHEVGERLGEDVRALLVEKARHLTRLARGLVAPARLLAAVDLRLDHAVAGLHGHGVDGAALGEWKGVDRLHRIRERVAEHLRHGDARDEAAHRGGDVGAYQRARGSRSPAGTDDVERSARDGLGEGVGSEAQGKGDHGERLHR